MRARQAAAVRAARRFAQVTGHAVRSACGRASRAGVAAGCGRAGLPVLLVLPTLLVVFLVIGIPLVYSLALSLHRINPLTQRWIFVGFANYAQDPAGPGFPRRLWPHRLFRCRHRARRPGARHGDGARAQHVVCRPQRIAQSRAGAVGDVAGRCRHPVELDAERRIRHLQRRPALAWA